MSPTCPCASISLAYCAESALVRRGLEAAAADARSALDTALATEASRCIKLVNDAAKRITPYTNYPAVRDLQAHIQALPQAVSWSQPATGACG
ncbi:hypothetical protein [Streptomyces sp. NPDC015242]|uniref:hypothetical protein n=1 Tax=Streptomyces sp. NPDC015242 TaxID=3364951 RepID=UPI00370239E3